jgi:hypothetical protein
MNPKLTLWERLSLAYHVFKRANRLLFNPVVAIEYDLPEGVRPWEVDRALRAVTLVGFDSEGNTTKKSLSF